MSHVEQEVVVEVRKTGIKPRKGAERVCSGELVRTLDGMPPVDLGLITYIPVKTKDGLPTILRDPAAYISRASETSFAECWKPCRQRGESAAPDIQRVYNFADTKRPP